MSPYFAYSTVTNQVSSGISPAPTYDKNGNQLSSTPATLTWNALNQPISVNSSTATYDAYGRMVELSSGSSTYKEFVYRPNGTLLAVYDTGLGLIKGTVPLPGGSTAIYNQSGLNYIRHTDWLGSSRLSTTWGHTVYSKEAYAPFGEAYNESGTPDRSFTGQDQDAVTGPGGTGVYDYLFRKYDPSAGRWLSPDPLGWGAVNGTDPQSLNRYAYVENQPLNAVDPQGLEYCISSDGDLYTNGSSNTSCPGDWTDAGGTLIQMQSNTCPTCFIPPPPALSDFTDSFDSFDFGSGSNISGALSNAWAFENKAIGCNISTLKHNGIATTLDAASLGADFFGPEEQYAKLSLGLGLSTASTINSSVNKDMTGAGLGMASYLKSTTELAANSAKLGWAKWIPFAGIVMDGVSAYHDVKEGIVYNLDCMAGQ